MKGSERHRLKENEIALSVSRLTEALEQRRRQIIWVAVTAVAVVATAIGIWYWRTSTDNDARRLLADAMAVMDAPVVPVVTPQAGEPAPPAPPAGSYPTNRARLEAALAKFTTAADAHPSSSSGLVARYEMAAALAALGRTTDAEAAYRQVIDRAGESLLGETARLGLASLQARNGQTDEAIAALRAMADSKDSRVPADGVLAELARVYDQAGQRAEALKIYQRILDEFPQSIYSAAARREVTASQSTGANL